MLVAAPLALGQDSEYGLFAESVLVESGDQVFLEGRIPPDTRGNVQLLAKPWPYLDEHVVREAPVGTNHHFFMYVRQGLSTHYRLRVPEITEGEPQPEMGTEWVAVYSTARRVFRHLKVLPRTVKAKAVFRVPEEFAFPIARQPASWYIQRRDTKRVFMVARNRTTAKGNRLIARVTFRRPVSLSRPVGQSRVFVCVSISPGQDIGLGDPSNPPCPRKPAPPKFFERAMGGSEGPFGALAPVGVAPLD